MMIHRFLFAFSLAAGLVVSCVKPAQETRISLNHTEMTLYVGADTLLTADVSPASSAGSVRWESLKPDIVSVSADGRITAVSVGQTQVLACVDGFKEGCRVKVIPLPVPVERVDLSSNDLMMLVGTTDLLTCSIYPSDADSTRVTWTSSDPLVAQVEDGVVEAVSEGTAYIRATVHGKCDSCKVEVVTRLPVSVSGVSLDETSKEIFEGKSFQLTASVHPEDADNQNVIWTSSDEDVAVVDENGFVEAVAPGQAEIIVTTEDGNHTATCAVTVLPAIKPVEEVRLDVQPEVTMKVGQVVAVSATILPEDARKADIVWESSDASGKIVTVLPGEVDSRITIKAMGNGVATVSAVVNDEGREFRTTVKITVDSGVSWNEGFASGDIEWD